MGYYIMKPDRDEDFYVEWSTYTDEPITYGTRNELQDYDSKVYSDMRFELCDEFGTSAVFRGTVPYKDVYWLGQSWEIPRRNIKAYVLETFEIENFKYWDEEFAPTVEKYATRLVFDD